MAKYLLKSKILATLNETLNKIKLAEAEAVTTPPEMDADGNFVSSVETKKKPSGHGVEIEQQIQDLSKDEVIKKAVEKIRDSIDVAAGLDEVIKQILGQDLHTPDQWKVNEDHNDVYLKSKDAHIFQQNDSICLSHHGKIEVFKTVDELHQWLREHQWPLPPAIEIHESIDLKENDLGSVAKDWNRLVDLADGVSQFVYNDQNMPVGYQYPGYKPVELTNFMKVGVKQGIQSFAGMPKVPNPQKGNPKKGIKGDNNSAIAYKLGLISDPSIKITKNNPPTPSPDKEKEFQAYQWITGNQTEMTKGQVNKTYTVDSFADQVNKGLSSDTPVPIDFGVHEYTINKDSFNDIITWLKKHHRAQYKNVIKSMLNNQKNPLPEQFRPVLEKELQQESHRVDNKIRQLLESSKKYPWLNEMINQNLITEDDTMGNALGGFDSAVAGAGGMDTSSNTTSTSTNSDTTFDPDTAPDLDLGDGSSPDLSGGIGGGLSGGNFNLNVKDGENGQIPQPNQKSYVVLDMIFKDDLEDDAAEQDSSDIIVVLKDEETGEIIKKPLNTVDTF